MSRPRGSGRVVLTLLAILVPGSDVRPAAEMAALAAHEHRGMEGHP